MTFAQAVKMLTKEYEEAMNNKYVKNPLAYALYKVWKKADQEGK